MGFGEGHQWRHYLGRIYGKSVASSSVFFGAGVAGIYMVGTLPEARRKGIGTALTLQPLIEARSEGYQLGILHSSPDGYGVYKRLGFKEYCKIRRFVWTNEGG